MAGSVISWQEFARQYSGPAKALADALLSNPYCSQADFNYAWKDINEISQESWREILEDWVRKKPGTIDSIKALVRKIQPEARETARFEAAAISASMGVIFTAPWGLDHAASFVKSMVAMAAANGCSGARVQLGYQSPDFASNYPRFIAEFIEIITRQHDRKLWHQIGKISHADWDQILQSCYREKGVGPETGSIIEAVAEAVSIVGWVAAVAGIIVLIVAAIFACFPGGEFVAIIFCLLGLILLVIAVGCFIARDILSMRSADVLALEPVQQLIRDGYWLPDPA